MTQCLEFLFSKRNIRGANTVKQKEKVKQFKQYFAKLDKFCQCKTIMMGHIHRRTPFIVTEKENISSIQSIMSYTSTKKSHVWAFILLSFSLNKHMDCSYSFQAIPIARKFPKFLDLYWVSTDDLLGPIQSRPHHRPCGLSPYCHSSLIHIFLLLVLTVWSEGLTH